MIGALCRLPVTVSPTSSAPADPPATSEPTGPRIHHLEMIQGVITRLALNSFDLKRWNVLLLSGALIFLARADDTEHLWVAVIPLLALWFLDGYFLNQERLFRQLYDSVRRGGPAPTDFSMATAPTGAGVGPWLRAALSRTLLLFHGSLTLAFFALVFVLRWEDCP